MKEYFKPKFYDIYYEYRNLLSYELFREETLIKARKQRKISFIAAIIGFEALVFAVLSKITYPMLFCLILLITLGIFFICIIILLFSIEDDIVRVEIIKHILEYRKVKYN